MLTITKLEALSIKSETNSASKETKAKGREQLLNVFLPPHPSAPSHPAVALSEHDQNAAIEHSLPIVDFLSNGK